jgi:hypothetical protein
MAFEPRSPNDPLRPEDVVPKEKYKIDAIVKSINESLRAVSPDFTGVYVFSRDCPDYLREYVAARFRKVGWTVEYKHFPGYDQRDGPYLQWTFRAPDDLRAEFLQ